MSEKSKTLTHFNKITTGYVIQNYATLKNGTTVCVGQEFIAGDQVDYEDIEGNPGYYSAKFFLRPHYQLEGLTVSLRLVSKLPSGKGG